MATVQQKSQLNVVLGTAAFGDPSVDMARVTDSVDVSLILDIFQAHGHSELDSARVYARGTSEVVIGQAGWQARGLKVATKVMPIGMNAGIQPPTDNIPHIAHTPEDLRKHLGLALEALQADSIDLFYLHGPDHVTPFEVTLAGVNALYREGKFKRFGLSNFASWEVAEVVQICRLNGYVQPTVYEGMYNVLQREVEPELFPCLRKYGISFYAYNPLAGGLLTGRYTSADKDVESGTRFDTSYPVGKLYRARYWNEHSFKALGVIEAATSKHGLTLLETAQRWLSHHSQLKREFGDSVIIGASSAKHVEPNLLDLEKGPLPEDVLDALDEAWIIVQPYAAKYFH